MRGKDGWEQKDIYGLRLIVEFSLFAVLAGLVPSLFKPVVSETTVWIIMSWGLGIFFLFEFTLNCCRVRHLYCRKQSPTSPVLLYGLIFAPTMVVGVVELISACLGTSGRGNACLGNVWDWVQPFIVAFGAIWLLVGAGLQLVQFFRRAEPLTTGQNKNNNSPNAIPNVGATDSKSINHSA